jgi:hypothetical protein
MIPDHNPLLADVDPEIIDALDARAAEISQGASASSTLRTALALGSVPIALGALARDVYGQAPNAVIDVLQFALLLEYLESDFYTRGLASAGLIPTADSTIFSTIKTHEDAHVTTLIGLLINRGKGQAPRLITDKATLNVALGIHSVEARHASEIRRLRGKKGWITGSSRDDLPPFLQPIYAGEENVTQAAVGLSAIAAGFGGVDSASEAFDEPLTKEQVTAIITPFLA